MNDVERRAGFEAGIEAAGLDPCEAIYWPGDFYLESGVAAGRDFLARADRPTAIFAASDFMAIGFMKTVSLGGVRVPQDVSVVGFDGIEFSDFVTPQLTTVSQPRHELGRVGARLLIKALNGSSTRGGVYLDAPLLLRGSTACGAGLTPSGAAGTNPRGISATSGGFVRNSFHASAQQSRNRPELARQPPKRFGF